MAVFSPPIKGAANFTAARKMYQIARPRPGIPVKGFVLSDAVHGLVTHWIDSRTIECMQQQGEVVICEHCLARRPFRWVGYLAIFDAQAGRIAIAECAAGASGPPLKITTWAPLSGGVFFQPIERERAKGPG